MKYEFSCFLCDLMCISITLQEARRTTQGFFKGFQSQKDREKEIDSLAAILNTSDSIHRVRMNSGFLQDLVHVCVSSLGQRRIERVPGPS